MKIVFLSNYYNHHQRSLCESWDSLTDECFTFVSMETIAEDRRQMGWKQETASFVRDGAAGNENIQELIDSANYVLLGSAPLSMVTRRLESEKLVFKYSERIFKKGYSRIKWLPRLLKYYRTYGRHNSLYLLAASAFAYWDFARHGVFKGKCYKWGYFPETKKYFISDLMLNKDRKTILWCGRFIDWKHPEIAIKVAERLRSEECDFRLEIIGVGPLEEELTRAIEEKGLNEYIELLGAMTPEQVRARMELAGIFLFTSDFNEGWGAVLNEAMNSGCAVVASHAIGAVPFLLQHGVNGLVYKNGDVDDLCRKAKCLLAHPEKQIELGEKAYESIVRLWNAEEAARRFLLLAEEIKKKGHCDLFDEGPCSEAVVVENNWFNESDYDIPWIVD